MGRFTEDAGTVSTEFTSIREQILDMNQALTEAIGELREACKAWAQKDNKMRIARAKAYLNTTGKNKEEREAKADAAFQKERLEANEAEGDKLVAQQLVQSLRTQISALQSLVYAGRAENESIRYNQTQNT